MSTKADIDVTYGLSADFYRLWLDRRMTYTGALFLSPNDTLDQAQDNKLEHHYKAARVERDSRVLDIGCGWGSNLEFLAENKGVRDIVGITLSQEQYDEILRRRLPRTRVECISYTDYRPSEPFDAVISIGMFEHIATPEQARTGESVEIYREYFKRAWQWTKPGAWFSLQTVIGARMPRGKALTELAWATKHIFPGAITPRLETIHRSVSPYWEVVELFTRREHYARTSAEWLTRLCANRETIEARWGSAVFVDYKRYLETCVMVFEEGYQSLAQFALRRIDK